MNYIHMLPFLDEEDLDELVEKILSGEVKGVKLMMLYPFLSRESIDKLVDHLIKENKGKEITRTLPFISKSKVNEIHEAVQAGTITGLKEMSLMPFLGKSKIKEMFNQFVKEAKDFEDDVEDEEDDE